MSNTPSTNTLTNGSSGAVAEFVPPVVQTSPEGQGGGSSPGLIGLPAKADTVSAHTSAEARSERLIVASPVKVVGNRGSFTSARTTHSTTEDPADLILYRSLIAQADLQGAARLCRERLLLAPEGRPAARWTKDLAITRIIAGDFDSAFELLAARYRTAVEVGGAFAGRYEVTFGHAYQQTGKFDPAFEHLTAAHVIGESVGDLRLCANTDVSTGRCYTAAKNPSASYFYFDRAEQVARRFEDWHLLGEIAESRALAFEAEERFGEATEAAWLSIQLLTQTGDRTAYEESARTYERVKAKSLGGELWK